MDWDYQQNKLNNGLHQDNNQEGLGSKINNSSEAIFEKMNKSPSSYQSCKAASDKRKRSDDEGPTSEKPTSRTKTHRCEFCPRTFDSGKALGGHKRHCQLQAQRKERQANNNNNNHHNTKVSCTGGMIKSSSCKGIIKTTCRICKRDFPSNMSLYGHMRTHTKDSPNHHNTNNQLLSADAATPNKPFIVLSKSLPPRSHRNDKRGKGKCLSSNINDEDVNVVEILVHMAQHKMSPPPRTVVAMKKNDDDDKRAIKLVVKLPYPASKGKLKVLQPDLYDCSICGKSFSTSQALGGHISSHNKDKEKNDNDSESLSTSEYYDPQYYDPGSESSSGQSISC